MLQETVETSFYHYATDRLGYRRNITTPNGHANSSPHMKRSSIKNSDLPILDEDHFQKNFDHDLMAATQAYDIVQGLIANLLEETSSLHLWLRNRALRDRVDALDRDEWHSPFEPVVENSLHNIKGIAAVLGAVRLRVTIGEALTRAHDTPSAMSVVRIRELIHLSEQTLRHIVSMRAWQPSAETEQHASTQIKISDEQLRQ